MPEKREKYGNLDPILDARAKREMYRNLNPLLDARQNENIQELQPTFGRETYRNSDPLLVAKVTSKPICIGGFIKVVNFLIQNPVQRRWWEHSVNPICYPSFTTRERRNLLQQLQRLNCVLLTLNTLDRCQPSLLLDLPLTHYSENIQQSPSYCLHNRPTFLVTIWENS